MSWVRGTGRQCVVNTPIVMAMMYTLTARVPLDNKANPRPSIHSFMHRDRSIRAPFRAGNGRQVRQIVVQHKLFVQLGSE